MKKILLLATSALLLLAGCAKEVSGPEGEGGLQEVTFTANIAGDDATKAAVDGDGAAANVNRCIMEIYYDDALFARQIKPVTNKQATFTCQVVANRTYKVAFWADHVTDASTEDGLAADLYYSTASLKTIALTGTYAGNNDARDAFFAADNYTIAQGGTACTATLYRPFAQVNVITTDWDKVSTVSSLKPDKVDVTIQNPLTKFNAVTGEASADPNVTSLNYNADLYTAPAPVQPVSTTEKTLSMDYLFAASDKAVIDIVWKAQKTDNTDVSHSFSNIPYQRNYRTNIKGALLTTTGQWNVTVDPIWAGEYTKVIEVADIQTANSAIAANTSANVLDVVFKSEPNDAGTPGTDAGARAIVTTPVAQSATLSIDVQSSTKTLYVGDYTSETDITTISSAAKTAVVNINVPTNSSIGTLVINAPTKSVYINGKQVSNVGTITNIDAITSQNTLIIVAGQTVNTLTMRQGGLEIHGTVNAVVIPEGHGTIVVRDCENLNEENVYNKLTDYIATGYFSEKGRTTEGLWDIFPAPCKIGTTYYPSLEAAAEAATSGQTIEVLEDIDFTKKYAKEAGHVINFVDNVTLNLSGKTITSNNYSVVYQGNGLTVKNGTFVAANNGSYALFIGDEIATTGVTIEGVTCSAGGMNIYNTTAVIKGAASTAAPTASATNYYAVWADENNTVVNIQSGKFKHNGSNPVVAADENGTIQITGGVYSAAPEASYVAPGYEVVANTDASTKAEYPYAVQVKSDVVAVIGSAEYSTLPAAFDAVTEGQTITLIKDCATGADYTINNALALSKNNVTFNLNEKSLTVTNNFSFILGGNNITLKNGNIVAGSAADKQCGIISYSVTVAALSAGTYVNGVTLDGLNVTGGIRFGGDETVQYKGGATAGVVKNCTVGSGDFYCIWAEQNSTVTVESGTFTNKHIYGCAVSANTGSTISLKGGTYNDNTDLAKYVADGYMAKANGTTPETWKVIKVTYPEAPTLPCVKIGDVWWAPVNCGYDATNYKYGKLYQWGRHDGCGYVASDAMDDAGGMIQTVQEGQTTLAAEDPNKFYYANNDWCSSQYYNLWDSSIGESCMESDHKPTKTDRDPCPEGWRLPTYGELNALIGNSGTTTIGQNGWDETNKGYWFNGTTSPSVNDGLFLPAAGCINYLNGVAIFRGTVGNYWCSSAQNGINAYYLFFRPSWNYCVIAGNKRAGGASIRCVSTIND